MNQLSYLINDGGRSDNNPTERLDCVVRALAIVLDIPYYQAHDLVKGTGRKDRHTTDSLMTQFLIKDLIGEKIDCKLSLNQFIKQYPIGIFFCHKRGHVFALKNGVVYDMGFISGRCMITYYAEYKPLTKQTSRDIL